MDETTSSYVWRTMPNGDFVAGNMRNGQASFAYATSEIADEAKVNPKMAAFNLLRDREFDAPLLSSAEKLKEYDKRMWLMINSTVG